MRSRPTQEAAWGTTGRCSGDKTCHWMASLLDMMLAGDLTSLSLERLTKRYEIYITIALVAETKRTKRDLNA